ncbi:MAG: hypothetical protein MI743_04580 [Sneathiellales bacterium]|nr:hypothetical protein [Sneathiellales bacterium]
MKLLTASFATLAVLASMSTASATVVNSFDDSPIAAYQWYKSDMREGGTASIESLSGKGGNLENNAPLPTGAAKLTTGLNNGDKAEVKISGNFGTVGDFIRNGTLSYDYFKSSSDANGSATASIKLEIDDGNTNSGDGYAVFVYEPYWNIVPTVSTQPPLDTWTNVDISGDSGTFWHTGIYGESNQAGGGNNGMTLEDWHEYFGGDLLDALITGVSVGIGTYNQGVTTYFDDVKFGNGQLDLAYDFEVSVIPLPAALPLYGAGLALLGLLGWRKRKAQA